MGLPDAQRAVRDGSPGGGQAEGGPGGELWATFRTALAARRLGGRRALAARRRRAPVAIRYLDPRRMGKLYIATSGTPVGVPAWTSLARTRTIPR